MERITYILYFSPDQVEIRCEKTGYFTEMEFKLKPFLGGAEYSNLCVGKIKLGKETLANVEGHWDEVIKIKDKKTGAESVNLPLRK